MHFKQGKKECFGAVGDTPLTHTVYPDPLVFPQLHLHHKAGKQGDLEEGRGGKCRLLLQQRTASV